MGLTVSRQLGSAFFAVSSDCVATMTSLFENFGRINFILAIGGLCMMWIGLRVVLQKRPFLVSARYGFWIMFLLFAPGLVTGIGYLVNNNLKTGDIASLIVVTLMLLVMLLMVWKQTEGYAVYGVDEALFRDALHRTLRRLQLPWEESISRLRLITLEADLEISIQSWMGTAYLHMKRSQHTAVFKRIIESLREDIASSPAKYSPTMSVLYLAFGILSLAASILM
jgi:hypothetical protein